MLRRKLIFNLGPMVVLLVLTTVIAMLLLQRVLRRLDHVRAEGWSLVEEANQPGAEPQAIVDHLTQVRREQQSLASGFRWLLIGLGLAFLVVINASVLMLIRISSMILRPVDALIRGTRELTQGHFDHRVEIEENDEFDELARAYNMLAEHLEQTEKRRIEVLGQVAIALNHELNNAMATIQLQLGMLGRSSGDPHSERRLRTIHQGLERMKDAVQSLKSVRRIVLTDYSPGMKMLDLEQSVMADHSTAQVITQ